jgi:hypothetical protein
VLGRWKEYSDDNGEPKKYEYYYIDDKFGITTHKIYNGG